MKILIKYKSLRAPKKTGMDLIFTRTPFRQLWTPGHRMTLSRRSWSHSTQVSSAVVPDPVDSGSFRASHIRIRIWDNFSKSYRFGIKYVFYSLSLLVSSFRDVAGSRSGGIWKAGSVLRIRDVYPGSRILIYTHPGSRISDPGSKNSNKREGWKKNFVIPFL